MNFLKFIVNRKIMVGLMVVLVLIIGSNAVLKLDKELMPPIEFDGAYVEVYARELSAIEIERNITIPLEKKIQGIEGVKNITTATNIGRSGFNISFEQGKGDELFKELETVVKTTTANITGVDETFVGKYGTNQAYEFFMDISAGDMDKMTDFAVNVLEPRLEALEQVRDVFLVGSLKNEVKIIFNREKIIKNGLDISQVISMIQQTNTEATIGELNGENGSTSLRWNTKLESVEDIKNILIPTQRGYIPLADIAEVSVNPLEESSLVWKNGSSNFILVQIGRVSNVTQIEMAEEVRKEIQEIKNEGLVKGFELNEIVAQADYVEDSINGVTDNILIGAGIAIAIMLLFLRNLRATLIVGISIPTSILLTFSTMWLLDYSVNILTLIGLGLGVGMMVDSSIVILESIYSKKEKGLSKFDAVIEGTKEVATAVIASMLTTIVVFLPIGLVGGEIGKFMIVLSAVVAVTLISSVIVSFTLIPVISEKFLKLPSRKKTRKKGLFMRGYSKLVTWAIRKKRNSIAVILIFSVMFGSSLFLVTKIPMNIMPDVFNRYAELAIRLEEGISLEEKEELVQKLSKTVQSIDNVETNYLMDNGNMLYMIINMTKGEKITREQKEINEDILGSLRNLKDSFPIKSVESSMSNGGGYPIQINIKGEDFGQLQLLADELKTQLKNVDGVVEVTNSIERTSIEEVIELKRDNIKKEHISEVQIRQFIQQALLEIPIAQINLNGEEGVPLTIEWDKKITNREELLNLSILTPLGEKTLSEFIEIKSVNTPNQISRIDGERYVSISADIRDRDLGSVNRDVQEIIENFTTPAGYTISASGDLEQQQELMEEMILVLVISIFLVYLVMAVQFNNLAHPFIVMSVIPVTIIGVIIGLFVTQRELNMMSGMGIVMLIGIVLNNAILLIDRTNQLRKEGLRTQEALIEAGNNRIRPIFMTTLTTVGGMLPLAMASGTSGNYQAPMATVIISGLLFATMITLVLIPAVYRLFSSVGIGVGMLRKSKKKKERVIKLQSAVEES